MGGAGTTAISGGIATGTGTLTKDGTGNRTNTINLGGIAGVQLRAGGAVLNQAGGTIRSGGDRGITSNAALTLTNLGTISGINDGVGVLGGASTVLNAGTISSSTNSGVAVGGAGATLSVTNVTGGTITGGSNATFGYGLGSNGQAMTVDNYGSIGSGARGLTAFNNGTLNANLYAGSSTGSILGSGGNDTVSLYTGTVNATALTRAYTDPVTNAQSTVTLQNAGTVAAASFGAIDLGGGTNTLNLRGTGDGTAANGAAGADGAVISGSTSVNKLDTGTFVLSGANTYSGATTISGGILNIQNATALGTTAAGTTVQSGGTLQLQNGITVTGEALSLAGNGSTGSNGALQNVSGANTYAGAITLAGASRINSDAGTLTLSGGIGGVNQNLTVGGAGATAISGAIATGTGTFTKDGAGTVTLTGVNTYTGATTINAGTLTLNNAAGTALADTSRVTFGNAVGTAATLQEQTSETIGSLSGGNISSTVNITPGTTLKVGGDNTTDGTYAGAINANGTGILAKTGSGTQTLTGAMTGGALVANAGTLAIGAAGSLNTAGVPSLAVGAPAGGPAQAAVIVSTGGTFANAGTITASNQGVVLQGGTFNNTGSVTAATQSAAFALTGPVAIFNTGLGTLSGVNGIDANLTTSDTIFVFGNGGYTGTSGFGIRAGSLGGDVTLGTSGGALGAVSGADVAILASTTGTGAVRILTAGNVTSTGGDAIRATVADGTAAVYLGDGVTISGASTGGPNHGAGVNARASGAGTVTIVAGDGVTVRGDQPGSIGAVVNGNVVQSFGNAAVVVGTSGLVNDLTGAAGGFSIITVGTGGTITATGIDATDPYQGNGVFNGNQGTGAANAPADGSTTVFTGTGTTITGSNGVFLAQTNAGNTSAATVSVDGTITGNGVVTVTAPAAYQNLFVNAGSTNANNVPQGAGVAAYNAGSGQLTVSGAGDIVGATTGILARAAGTGDITILGTGATSGNGGVVGLNGNYAIDAQITNVTSAGTIFISRSGTITGANGGILARTAGSGNIAIYTSGNVTGTAERAILASSDGAGAGFVGITTAAGTNVQSGGSGSAIVAQIAGGSSGPVSIFNAAAVDHTTGAGNPTGIYALRGVSNGSGTVVVTNAGEVSGQPAGGGFGAFQVGISALSTGTGNVAVVNGGTIGAGIAPTTAGIVAQINNAASAGTITIDGAGMVNSTSTAGYGVFATTNGTGNLRLGRLGPFGAITATGTGATGIGASITNASSAGNVAVTSSGLITAGGSGITASTAGTGTVRVSSGPITTTNGSGVVATGTTGAVAVTANGTVTAGGAGNAGIFLIGNNAGNTVSVASGQAVQSAIGLRVAGAGTTTLSNGGTIATTGGVGANALQVDGGTLVIGDTAGTLTGNLAVVNVAAADGNGASVLSVNRTVDLTLANTITGAGTLNQSGSSTTILNGVNSAANGQFTGTANVNAGILSIGGAGSMSAVFGDTAGNAAVVNVNTDGTLHGSGTIAGSVVVNGGTVSAGNSPGTLTVVGNYTLNTASTSLYELGAPGFVGGASNDLINVGGNLALAGTLNLVAASNAATAPVSGAYRLYNYGGTLTGGFGTVTTPTAGTSALVYTNIPNQVNVLLTNGNQSVQYFDGADLTGAAAGAQGGTGTWNAGNTNWTMLPGGQVNDVWRSGVGIFGTTAGTVTVAGAQNLQGLQFTVDGYQLTGTGTLNLTGDPFTTLNQSFVNVDTGVVATIANALTSTGGTIGLRKLGDGTLTLTGASTYTGATTVSAGTLTIAVGGSITSDVANNATFTNAGTVTGNLANAGLASNAGTITGTATNTGTFTNDGTVGGGLTNAGNANNTGAITGAAANLGTFTNSGTVGGGLTNSGGITTNTGTINGGAAILAGTFVNTGVINGTLSNAGTVNAQGQINGDVANQIGGTFTVTGGLTGIGRLTNDGAVDLGGNSLAVGSLTGSTAAATIANGGTLSAEADGTSSAYAGQITGATALTKLGAGTLTLSGTNTYTGATAINAGTLQAGAVNAFSAGSTVTIAPGARMDLASFNQTIASLAGAGSVTLGSGILTTGGSNASTTYAGTISGTGGVTKVGTGTFTLSGANSYTGTTTVSAGTLANTGSLAGPVANAATFTNSGSVAGALANAGTTTNTGSLNGGVANTGTLTTFGTIAGGLTNTGTVTASAGRIDGAIANNAGTFTVTGNVASNGTFGNAGGATLAVTGSGAYGIAGLLTNAGSLTVASGGSLTAPAGIVNSGSIAVAQGGTITDALANTGSVVNDGRYNADVSNAAPGTIANRTTGVWTGNLTANTGSVSNAGLWQSNARNDAGGTLTNTGTWTTASAPVSNAGTLSNTGTINGGVANGGTFGNAATLNGGLSNSAGTATNTGTINGAVAVTGGSLATSGTINGAVTNAGAITASGRIAGAVTNAAGGSFVLTGPLAGVTTFTNNGTLDLGRTAFTVGSLSGSNAAAILRNGALATNGDNSSTGYAGTIVDGGSATSLTKLGTGTLTLTGTNTYSGGTTVSAGTLVASAASLGSGGVTSNTTLVIDQASDATLGSALNGTGRFVKQGAGTLTYTGTGSFSGPTTVATGGFVVNGSLAASPVTVANAAVVGGTGTIGGLTVQSGAIVAPGASTAAGSLGTLTVNGNVLFASQSIYRVDATAAGQSDRIASTGTATLQGGTVQVTAGTGAYAPSTRYTILTAAGGLTGRFAGVTSN
ncbi:beta strand repeat-containing protein, partial [Methylobacterium sp. J-092]|uniref:beta strand repeat-containing protein n=1 Tax=Methylobacterium sp. J-092 TaxID=2836667 RepID=UPI001FBB2D99